jgi:hypothetical protein
MNEQELIKKIAELPREMRPKNDPWEKISARLGEHGQADGKESVENPSRRWMQGWPLSAVAAVAVVAITFVVLSTPEQVTEPTPSDQVAASGSMNSFAAIPDLLAESEAEYQAAFREFITVGDSREQIPVTTVEKIETGWADLVQVETALTDALEQNPNDPFLNKRLLELRARQLGFLRQLAVLDHSNRRLTI